MWIRALGMLALAVIILVGGLAYLGGAAYREHLGEGQNLGQCLSIPIILGLMAVATRVATVSSTHLYRSYIARLRAKGSEGGT